MIHRPVLVALLLTACGGNEESGLFVPDVFYTDTLAIVGTVDEENPLFLFSRLSHMGLLDDSTVVYTEGGASRLIVANMVSGEGWEIQSRNGAAGPGEFGGENPIAYSSAGLVRTITISGRYNTWTKDGELVESNQLAGQDVFGLGGEINSLPVGIVGRYIVGDFSTAPDWQRSGPQTIERGIRLFNIESGSVTEIREDRASHTVEVIDDGDGRRHTEVVDEQAPFFVVARHDLIVHAIGGASELTVRSESGETLLTRDVGYPISDVKVDAGGRIWVNVRAESEFRGAKWIVMGRELQELFRTITGMRDAYGAVVLSLVRDEELDMWNLALVGRSDR